MVFIVFVEFLGFIGLMNPGSVEGCCFVKQREAGNCGQRNKHNEHNELNKLRIQFLVFSA